MSSSHKRTHTYTRQSVQCACLCVRATVHVKVAYSAHKATGSLRSGALVCLLATLTSIMSQLVLVQLLCLHRLEYAMMRRTVRRQGSVCQWYNHTNPPAIYLLIY